MIKSIILEHIRNVKERVTENLTGMDIYNGENGAGKSTRLDAIKLTIMGWIKGNDKTNLSAFKDANDNSMTTGVVTDEHTYTRTFFENSGQISQSIEIDGEEMKLHIGNDVIQRDLGQDVYVFDLNEFLGLSDSKKKDFLFRMGKATSNNCDRQLIEQIFRNLISHGEMEGLLKFKYKVKSLSELTPEQFVGANKTMIQSLSEYKQMAVEKIIDYCIKSNSTDVQQYLSSVRKYLEDDLKYRRKVKRDSEAVNREFKKMKQNFEISVNIEELKAEIDANRKNITDISVKIAENAKNRQVIAKHQEDMEKVERILKELKSQDVKKTRKESDKVKGVIENVVEASLKLNILLSDKQLIEKDIKSFKVAVKSAEKVRVEKFCVILGQLPCDTDLAPAIENLKLLVEERENELLANESDINNLTDELKMLYGLTGSVDEFLKNLNAQKSRLDDAVSKIGKEIEFYQERRLEIQKTDLTKFNVVEDGIYSKELESLKVRAEELDLQEKDQRAIKEKLISIESAAQSTLMADEYINLDKKAIAAVKEMINRWLAKSIDPIKEVVNQLLYQINAKYKFDMRLDDKDRLLYGWKRDDGFSPFESLSDGETVLFSIALITALIIKRDPPLKVLCVKAGGVSYKNFQLMLGGLAEIKPHLDNILVEYPYPITKVPLGWEMHELQIDD